MKQSKWNALLTFVVPIGVACGGDPGSEELPDFPGVHEQPEWNDQVTDVNRDLTDFNGDLALPNENAPPLNPEAPLDRGPSRVLDPGEDDVPSCGEICGELEEGCEAQCRSICRDEFPSELANCRGLYQALLACVRVPGALLCSDGSLSAPNCEGQLNAYLACVNPDTALD